MSYKVNSDEDLMLLSSPTYNNKENEQTEKPKLTMKLLYELIKKLKQENILLSERVDEFEQQLDLLHQVRDEVAATTLNPPVQGEPGITADLDYSHTQSILIPRSERHPSKKNKSFWTYFFRPST